MTEAIELQLERLLIGSSIVMQRLRALIVKVARTRLSVLLQGPTGSGKELVARGLHLASERSGDFVAVNVCAIGETMFEDALFGHVKGAFTGATHDVIGYFAEANGGTILLDEINGLAKHAQAKLLRVLETQRYRAVGSSRDRCSDFRVVAATNEDLTRSVSRGTFREDLIYRLSGAVIQVPPLSARLEDLRALVEHIVERESVGHELRVSDPALARLAEHTWPGNVRELRHVLLRAMMSTDGGVLRRKDVAEALAPSDTPAIVIDDIARRDFIDLLAACEWDTAEAAQRLGVNRTTIYRRMQRLGITSLRLSAEVRHLPSARDREQLSISRETA